MVWYVSTNEQDYNPFKKGSNVLDGPVGDQLLSSPIAVDQLLSTALSRESNGIAKG